MSVVERLQLAAWAVPLLLLSVVLLGRWPTARYSGAALLSFAWTLGTLPLLTMLAARFGWWSFSAETSLWFGAPFDVSFGWMLLWGPVPLLIAPRSPIAAVLAALLLLDLQLMPRLAPLLELHERWGVGEALGLTFVLLPAQLFGRWTLFDRFLAGRVTLLLVCFGLVVLWLLPYAVLAQTGSDTSFFWAWGPRGLAIGAQVIAVAGVLGLAAVLEFLRVGRGTPLPFDPPRHLVTTGPYAFVANPMQVSTAAVFVVLGFATGSLAVGGIAGMAFVYGIGFGTWSETADLQARFGRRWQTWKGQVRPWAPRWRPWYAAPSTLWVAEGCGACQQVQRWLERRGPVSLQFRAAEDHPSGALTRITYEGPEGQVDAGVAALGRALEHLTLAWAWIGFFARLPGVTLALTVLVDAVGGGPRLARRSNDTRGRHPVGAIIEP